MAAPVLDRAGNLYGTTCCIAGIVWELLRGSWEEETLQPLKCRANGCDSTSSLTFDSAGNLYGTTLHGGKYNDGVVFKLTRGAKHAWKETKLYSFTGGSDGSLPQAGVILDSKGNLYGTTVYGGSGYGTVFKLTPGSPGHWKETVLHQFTGSDGETPNSGLTIDAAGNLYGMTPYGGNPSCSFAGSSGCGVVFEITP